MSGLKMKYFVLKPQSKTVGDPYAKASRLAMEAYAKEIRDINPKLSLELSNWVNEERFKLSKLALANQSLNLTFKTGAFEPSR